MKTPFFKRYSLKIGKGKESPFLQKYNVFQDGTTPMYRDAEGTLWAMSGHSHMGSIAVFSGSCPKCGCLWSAAQEAFILMK